MAFENTDAALANVVNRLTDLSSQLQPDVLPVLAKAAMLKAQAHLVDDAVGIIFFGLVVVFCLKGLFWAKERSDDDTGAIAFVICAIVGAVALIPLFCCVSEILSPLNIQAAQDGTLALAQIAMKTLVQQQ